MPKKIIKEEAEKWLLENTSGRYVLIDWAGDGSQSKSLFLDTKRDVKFNSSLYEVKRKLSKDPDYIFSPSKKELSQKREKTNFERYGAKSCLSKQSSIKNNIDESNLQKFGSKNVGSLFRQKAIETTKDRYGVPFASQNKEIVLKTQNTNLEKYGVKNTFQLPVVKEKFIQNFGVDNPFKSKIIQDKAMASKIASGSINTINGKTILELSNEIDFCQSHINKIYREYGEDKVLLLKKEFSLIEEVVKNILDGLNVKFLRQSKVSSFFPDFVIPEHNLIIECDGLYWHSDKFRSPAYHKNKKEEYIKNGFRSLFFRENEILDKADIVKSIILNKINSSKKIFARKTEVVFIKNNDFFKQNHLMGKGSGECFFLYDNEEGIVAGIQVKWKNKNKKEIEISRFCTKNGVSVVGGFSKLLNQVKKKFEPNKIITFIDQRYGDGDYLSKIGFEKRGSYTSFKWVKGIKVLNRMIFPGNSGYEKGFLKLWDCGQAKWEMKCF